MTRALAAVAAAAMLATAVLAADYTLQPGDVLHVIVFGEKDLSGSYRVSTTGTVVIPGVGPVSVGGLTTSQAQAAIREALKKLLRHPRVTVALDEAASVRKVQVSGAVEQAGTLELPFGSTLLDALAAAGVQPDADLRRIQINRPGQKALTVDVSGWRTGEAPPPVVLLRSGDIIFVPRLTERISVLGAVNKPGSVLVPIGQRFTVLDAIARLGEGLAPQADSQRAFVIRGSQTLEIDLAALLERGDARQNIQLQPGDVVLVPQGKRVTVVGSVKQPGSFIVPRPVPVLDALAQAGGPTEQADLERCKIISAGQITEIDLQAYLDRGEKPAVAELKPGDVLVVPKQEPQEVLITGAVEKAGVLDLHTFPNADLLRVISVSGLSESADATRVTILRGDKQFVVNYRSILEEGRLDENVPLQSGDIVYVPDLGKVYLLGALRMGSRALPCPREGLGLLDALVAAGGLAPNANGEDIHIVRPRPDGTTEHIRVGMSMIKRGTLPGDITLRPGDVVYVGYKGRPFSWRELRDMIWVIGGLVAMF